ncbi:uncharacterized protein LOC114910939 [Scleropages formosus]|uniref:uncharacterized protein LOC114910939 n=1 Tax=Scleropages formosus TaxID=113540 RepID=UPI0010FA8FF3|nr:uncharacterized protein C15orf39 homolog [Scleropages formosus]
MRSNIQTFADSAVHNKLPRLLRPVEEIGLHGFSASQSLSRYSNEESEKYLSLCFGGKEGKDISPHWNPSKTYLQINKNPVLNTSITNRPLPSQISYRPEHTAVPIEESPYLEPKDFTPKQKLTFSNQLLEMRRPSILGDHMSVPLSKLGIGNTNVSQKTDSVNLAIPKPVYGHKSCCLENQCPSGPSYRIHHRGSRIHPTTFDQELMSEYSPISLLQRKECEALMQRQMLEHKQRLTLQEAQPEDYRTIEHSGPIKMPAFLEPNYRSFPHVDSSCSLLSPSVGQYHHLQFPSKVYHTLPVSSSGSYEEMQQMTLSHSDKLYTDHIPDGPKHTQRPLHPAFYYVQESLNVPNGAVYADIRGNHRHTVSSPVNKQSAADQYLVPHPASDETSSSCSISPSSHSCLNSYEVSAYQLHKMHLNSGQKRTFSDGPGFTLSIPHAEQVEDYSEKKSRVLPSSVGLCSQGFGSGAFHRVQPRFDHENFCHDSKPQCNLRESPKMDDRLTSPNGSVNHSITNRCQRETGGTDVQSSHSDPCSSLFTAENVTTLNNTNKVIINQSSNLKQIASENVQNRLENPKNEELYDKWVEGPDLPPSPPMPVIHSVFSLAPYKAYLEATGMLPAQNMLGGGNSESVTKKINPGRQNFDNDSQQELHEIEHRLKPVIVSQSSCENVSIKMEFQKIKTEENADEVTNCSFEINENECKEVPKKEDFLTALSACVLDLSVRKSESDDSTCKLQKLAHCSAEYRTHSSKVHGAMDTPELSCSNNSLLLLHPGPQQSIPSPRPLNTQFWLQHVPHQQPKLSAFKTFLPDMLKSPSDNTTKDPFHSWGPNPQPKLLVETTTNMKTSRCAQHHFMELHQSLCRLILDSVSCTPEQELRAWLDKTGLGLCASSQDKSQSISSLLRAAVKDSWLRCNDTVAAFQQIISQLKDFVSSNKCPFPHVVRAGMVFVPMLVVKESLFPQVPGTSIDQLLQELKVELRPTTLSEERHFAKLQGHACSSKLRRLLSLKHLPDVYPDVLNLFYHVCASKRLGAELSTTVKKEQQVHLKDSDYSAKCSQSSFSVQDSPKNKVCFKKQRRQGRRKNVSKRLFSEEHLQHEGYVNNWSIVKSLSKEEESSQGTCREDLENVKVKMEQDSSHLEQDGMGVPDSAWAPVMSDDFSTGSDTETERTYAVSCQSHCSTSTTLPNSQTHSGMILKLRKVLFNKGPVGSESIHPRTCKSGSCGPPVYTENRKAAGGRNYREITWKIHGQVAKRVKGGSSQGLRSTRSSSKAVRLCRSTKTLDLRKSTKALHLHRSMVHIKYCSYLSANHSKQRRRWVLRSAVRTARQAMKERYPELVGKRICHLYEEKDKSEVWYKGVVVRVHEPHPNPLKTVFEVKYDSEPEWQYYLELLMDYKKGWLKVED